METRDFMNGEEERRRGVRGSKEAWKQLKRMPSWINRVRRASDVISEEL